MKVFWQALSIIVLIAALAVGGTYALPYIMPCRRVLAYDIGQLDPEFKLSKEAFVQTIVAAEAPWEQTFGREFFVYKPGAAFKVNLIYDYRQEESNKNKALSEAIDSDLSTYSELEARYNTLSAQYKTRLADYNGDVAYWNAQGGAPEDEYTKLEKERLALNGLAQQVNVLANRLNTLSQSANQKVDTYNASAGKVFDKGEFTQIGINKAISIYEFQSMNELKLALTHELGHALGADHVANEKSVMYPVLQKQDTKNIQLTAEDQAEITRVCKL